MVRFKNRYLVVDVLWRDGKVEDATSRCSALGHWAMGLPRPVCRPCADPPPTLVMCARALNSSS